MSVSLTTTKMSSKGQVVIPESVREELGLKAGSQFVVLSSGDTVMLKVITPPTVEEFRELSKRVRNYARNAGLKKSDIPKAIAKARGHE